MCHSTYYFCVHICERVLKFFSAFADLIVCASAMHCCMRKHCFADMVSSKTVYRPSAECGHHSFDGSNGRHQNVCVYAHFDVL